MGEPTAADIKPEEVRDFIPGPAGSCGDPVGHPYGGRFYVPYLALCRYLILIFAAGLGAGSPPAGGSVGLQPPMGGRRSIYFCFLLFVAKARSVDVGVLTQRAESSSSKDMSYGCR